MPHGLTCTSGTLAVEAALRALGISAGDEVVLAAYDYESNFLTVHALGAKPVLIDVSPDNWQFAPANLEAAITPRTKAVICSHLHGGIVPMRAVMEIARRCRVGVVEDAAQAIGAVVEGMPAGTWGDVGVLSFGGSKLLTAGRGGALLFRDSHLHQRAESGSSAVAAVGAVSELQAAHSAQAAQLREMTRLREERAAPRSSLDSDLASSPTPSRLRAAFYKLGFQYDPAAFGLPRDLFVAALRAEGIAFDAGFKALHAGRSPSRYRAASALTHATAANERCVVLHHPVLSLSQVEVLQVAEAVAKTYRFRDTFAKHTALDRA